MNLIEKLSKLELNFITNSIFNLKLEENFYFDINDKNLLKTIRDFSNAKSLKEWKKLVINRKMTKILIQNKTKFSKKKKSILH
jgi:hypothetical protein